MKLFKALLALALLSCSVGANAQLIHGNTFPYWTVTGNTTSGTLVVTGDFTLSGGISGVVTASNATAGQIGEVITATVPTPGAVATSATAVNITSISLTPGDWDVSANCVSALTGSTSTIYTCALGTTSATQLTQAGATTASMVVGTDPRVIQTATFGNTITGVYSQNIAPVRVKVVATATLYLVATNTYSAGSQTVYGTLRARRMR